MNSKKLTLWVGALVVVVLIIIVSEMMSNRKPSEKVLKFFPALTDRTITAVQIMDSEDTVKIRRKGDIWVVAAETANNADQTAPGLTPDTAAALNKAPSQEYPADSASIQTALEKITGMKKDILISANPEKQATFEVDSAKGLYVEIWDSNGKSAGAMRIGKSGPDWSSNYVRMIGSNDVFSVGGSIRYAFFTDQKRWRDKSIMKFDRATAKRISIVKAGGAAFALAKADTGSRWDIAEPISNPAKTEQVDEILNTLSNLTAAEYEDSSYEEAAMGFSQPELVATVSLGNNVTKKLTVGKAKPDAGKYWVRAEGKDNVFLVNDYEIQKLDKSVDVLKADPVVPTADLPTADTQKK